MLSELLKQKRFVLTAEAAPPRGPDFKLFKHEVSQMPVDAVNVVDIPGALLLPSSLGTSIAVKLEGKEPIFQLTCRDRNILALQADLLSAASFGIENVLSLTGDHPAVGDHPFAKPVFEVDSVGLLQIVSQLNKGFAINGSKLNTRTRFFAGAGVSPFASPLEPEVFKIKKKLAAGAQFFQTQVVFGAKEIEEIISLYEKKFHEDIASKIIPGVIMIHDRQLLDVLVKLPGFVIPDKIVKRINSTKKPRDEAVQIALEIADSLKQLKIGGLHLVHCGNVECLKNAVKELRK